jgi:hypothetical protein
MEGHEMARGMENLRLRWPKPLRDRIAAEAEKAGRSINSEILHRLGLTLDPQWQEKIAELEKEEAAREKRDRELREKGNELWETNPKYRESVARMIAKLEATGRKDRKKG